MATCGPIGVDGCCTREELWDDYEVQKDDIYDNYDIDDDNSVIILHHILS